MRIIPWIRAEIRSWLGVEEQRLGFDEKGAITFNAPHPDKIEGREALQRLMKNRWTVNIGSGLAVASILWLAAKLV